MNARPPRKQNARQGQRCQRVRARVADMPQPRRQESPRRPGRYQDEARNDEDAVQQSIPRERKLFGAVGPERRRHPADDPSNPDDGEHSAWVNEHVPLTPHGAAAGLDLPPHSVSHLLVIWGEPGD
jgi:hypothetical protein